MKLWKLALAVVAIVLLGVGGITVQDHFLQQQPSQNSGSFSPTGGGTYYLASSVGTNDTSIRLQSFNEPVSDIAYSMSYLGSTIEFGTLAPQTDHSEFISFTGITPNVDGSVTLTGVLRGLSRTPGTGGCVASSTLAQPHSGQEIFILSNSPCFYSNYITNNSGNTNTIGSLNIFSSTTPPRLDEMGAQAQGNYISTTSEFATVGYVDAVALSGAPNASQTVKGVVQIATARQAASSTGNGSTGAVDVLAASSATDTPQNCSTAATGGCVVMSLLNGKLSQLWLDLTQTFNFTNLLTFSDGFLSNASSTFSATTSIAASNVNSNPLSLNGVKYAFPSSQSASSFLENDGSGNLSWGVSQVATIFTNPNINVLSSAGSTTTIYSITIPANTLNATNKEMMGSFFFTMTGNCVPSLGFGNGSATTTIGGYVAPGNSANFAEIDFSLVATTTSSELSITKGSDSIISTYVPPNFLTPTASITSQTYIAVNNGGCGAGALTVASGNIVVYTH